MTGEPRLVDRVHTAVLKVQPLATWIRVAVDTVAWGVAATLALYLRFDLEPSSEELLGLRKVVPLFLVIQLLTGIAVGLYRRRWLYGGHDEVGPLVATAGVTTVVLFLLNRYYFEVRPIPQSVVLVAGVFGLVGMAAIRYLWRMVSEWIRRPSSPDAQRAIVYGAGEEGLRVVVSLLRNRDSRLIPVAMLDDQPTRQRLSVMGVSVMGGRAEVAEVAARSGADVLLIAEPNADANLVGQLVDLASDAGLRVQVLPSIDETVGQLPGPGDIRDVTETDLLGRHQIQTDVAEIAHYLTGRTVLVTGAGGSIGSELCRQLQTFAPARLVMLDRDESALHAVELSIRGRALLDSGDSILADIRDHDRLVEVFEEVRPDVVFHAAALKHLPLLELFPVEAFKSNVVGTYNVLTAARRADVSVFVNVSTDKAANPTSILGYSKRVAERLTAHVGAEAERGQYMSVRFGNVLGSRGSVLLSFRDQIARGGPVTVTDEHVTRYFMTVAEAVQLVIQAGAIGSSGEVLVLDMGEPVRIHDVARRLIAQAGRDIAIEITGLRPGEKLHEELFGEGEFDLRPRHPLISHAPVPGLDPAELDRVERAGEWMAAASRVTARAADGPVPIPGREVERSAEDRRLDG